MKKLKLLDGKGERRDTLDRVCVQSSGGVPPVWAALLKFLPRHDRVLDWGSWHGLAALWLRVVWDNQVVYAHSSSLSLARVRDSAAASGVDLETAAMFPLTGQWDTIILAAPQQNEALDLMAGQATFCLIPGGQVLVVDKQDRSEVLKQQFANVSLLDSGEGWAIVRCQEARSQEYPLPWRNIQVLVRGIQAGLDSLPGNFSPQGLDRGTRAMLEEAQITPGARVLDLACGYGVVGIVAAKLGAGEVVYVDDDLVALAACRHNLDSLGLAGELVHSHDPSMVAGKFDCILTNPPYHTDYGVAKRFIDFAAERLTCGGWLYVVVKKPDWYVNKIRALFGGCRVVERDGYSVISTQRRPIKSTGINRPKTTRKHARRQQATKGRGRKNG